MNRRSCQNLMKISLLATLVAAGLIGLFGTAAQAQGEESATITVAHFAPFADTVEGTAVDVLVDGSVAIPTLTYPSLVGNVPLPASDYLVQVALQASGAVIISDTLTVAAGADYTVAAIGGANGWTAEYYVLENDTSAPADGSGKVRISHLAPFADTLDGTRVDICTEAGDVVGGLAGIPYKASSPYLELPAGLYDLKVTATATDCGTTLIDVPAVTLLDGAILDVFAVGDGVNQTPSIVVNDQTPPAVVDVAHFAPFGESAAGTSVTVRIDGEDALTDVVYPTVATDVELAAGTRLVEIIPTGSDTVAISATVPLAPGGDYTVIAVGDGVNQPLMLKVLDNSTAAPAAGNAKLRVGHLAPFAADIDGTRVDICLENNTIVPGLNGVPYDVISPYLELPAATYDLKIAVAGTNCAEVALDLDPFVLGDGEIADAYAIGTATDAFPLTAASVTGLTPGGPTAIDDNEEPDAPVVLDEFIYIPLVF